MKLLCLEGDETSQQDNVLHVNTVGGLPNQDMHVGHFLLITYNLKASNILFLC